MGGGGGDGEPEAVFLVVCDPSINALWATYSLYYKPITIVNDNSSIANKLETSLIDDARVIIYDHQMFVVQATRQVYA